MGIRASSSNGLTCMWSPYLACCAYRKAISQPLSLMSKIPWDQVFSFTLADGVKLVVTAVVILMVNKIQLFSDRLSALLIALPLTSLIAMMWMYQGGQGSQRIANHSESTFWFVLPTLPMFLILPWMLRQGWGFGVSLTANCMITVTLFWVMVILLKRFGVDLMG